MVKFKTQLALFLSEEHGVTAIEYALLGALIAVVIVVAVASVGTNLNALYEDVAGKVSNAISGSA